MPVAPLNIEVPPASEVIPIHTSDRSAFKFCRRRWDWSSPMRRNLVPKTVQFPLWFGTGFHYALEMHYAEGKEPIPRYFVDWFNAEMVKPDVRRWLEDADQLPATALAKLKARIAWFDEADTLRDLE